MTRLFVLSGALLLASVTSGCLFDDHAQKEELATADAGLCEACARAGGGLVHVNRNAGKVRKASGPSKQIYVSSLASDPGGSDDDRCSQCHGAKNLPPADPTSPPSQK